MDIVVKIYKKHGSICEKDAQSEDYIENFVSQDSNPEDNLVKGETIRTNFPKLDIICFQVYFSEPCSAYLLFIGERFQVS